MPRFNVQRDDGLWACFSTVCDGFITDFLPRDEYDQWRKNEYGTNWSPIEQCNLMSYEEALSRQREQEDFEV